MTFTAILPEVGVKPVVEVSRVTADSADAVAEFMRRVWGGNVSGERVRRWVVEAARTNPAVTGEGVPAVVYLRDREAFPEVVYAEGRMGFHNDEGGQIPTAAKPEF